MCRTASRAPRRIASLSARGPAAAKSGGVNKSVNTAYRPRRARAARRRLRDGEVGLGPRETAGVGLDEAWAADSRHAMNDSLKVSPSALGGAHRGPVGADLSP